MEAPKCYFPYELQGVAQGPFVNIFDMTWKETPYGHLDVHLL